VKKWVLILSSVVLSACQRTPGEVVDKVLTDFGVREKPEGYETASDHVFNRLSAVGSADLKRMNQEGRRGEVKFQDEGDLSGKYYKEVKVYEAFHPLEATSVSRTTQNERGFVGYIEYDYRIYQSPRTTNRTEAEQMSASIRTTITGRETRRYAFNAGGAWNGAAGELVKRRLP